MRKLLKIVMALLIVCNTMTLTKAEEQSDLPRSLVDENGLVISMDEDGNISYVDVEEEIEVIDEDARYQVDMNGLNRNKTTAEEVDYQSEELDTAATNYVVRFRNSGSVINYTEVDTGIEGYTYAAYGADAAYLGTNSSGTKVKFKLSGVTGWVSSSLVELVPFSSDLNLSYYMIKNGKFYHFVSGNVYGSGSVSTQRLSEAPEGLKANTKYYSYDGHYFYKSYSKMLKDYRNNVCANAENATIPYYNYYQFLPIRSTTHLTSTVINRRVAQVKSSSSGSKLLNSGASFKASEKFGVNAIISISIAINESGWGTSNLAKSRNNLFGIGAYDGAEYNAKYFSSISECTNYFAKNLLSLGYCDPTSWYYYGPHIGDKQSGINVKYSSDPYWGEKAAAHAYYFEDLQNGLVRKQLLVETQDIYTYIYKEPDIKSKLLYRNGNYDGRFIRQFPFLVIDKITNSQGTWYKVLTDGILLSDRSDLAKSSQSNGYYNPNYCYAYILANESQRLSNHKTIIDKYEDLNRDEWYYSVVSKVVDHGFMNGTDEKHFSPDTYMTRAMVVNALFNIEGRPDVTFTSTFPDVKDGLWYSNAIIWANQANIISGYKNGKFGPDKTITREDFCVILRNYIKYKGFDTSKQVSVTSFKDDQNITDYALSSVKWAVASKILTGSNNCLLPTSKTTRAQACKMIWMTYGLIQ